MQTVTGPQLHAATSRFQPIDEKTEKYKKISDQERIQLQEYILKNIPRGLNQEQRTAYVTVLNGVDALFEYVAEQVRASEQERHLLSRIVRIPARRDTREARAIHSKLQRARRFHIH